MVMVAIYAVVLVVTRRDDGSWPVSANFSGWRAFQYLMWRRVSRLDLPSPQADPLIGASQWERQLLRSDGRRASALRSVCSRWRGSTGWARRFGAVTRPHSKSLTK